MQPSLKTPPLSKDISSLEKWQQRVDKLKIHRAHAFIHDVRGPFVDFFKNGQGMFTDLVVRCKDRQWRAHRHVLMERCDFFRACLQPGFTENESQIIHMDDEEPQACLMFLQFLYKDTIDELQPSQVLRHPVSHQVIIALCSMADKYNTPAIFERLVDFFERNPAFRYMSDLRSSGQLDVLIATKDLNKSTELLLLRETLVNLLTVGPRSTSPPSEEIKFKLLEHPDTMFELLEAALRSTIAPLLEDSSTNESGCDGCEE